MTELTITNGRANVVAYTGVYPDGFNKHLREANFILDSVVLTPPEPVTAEQAPHEPVTQ